MNEFTAALGFVPLLVLLVYVLYIFGQACDRIADLHEWLGEEKPCQRPYARRKKGRY